MRSYNDFKNIGVKRTKKTNFKSTESRVFNKRMVVLDIKVGYLRHLADSLKY